MLVERLDGDLQVFAADTVEVDIDAIGCGRRELTIEIAGSVVDRRVETELLEQLSGLDGTTGRADHPLRAEGLGDLARHAADRSRCRRDEHGVAGLYPGDVGERGIGGESRGAEHAQEVLRCGEFGVDGGGRRGVDDGVFAPSGEVRDRGADRDIG